MTENEDKKWAGIEAPDLSRAHDKFLINQGITQMAEVEGMAEGSRRRRVIHPPYYPPY